MLKNFKFNHVLTMLKNFKLNVNFFQKLTFNFQKLTLTSLRHASGEKHQSSIPMNRILKAQMVGAFSQPGP